MPTTRPRHTITESPEIEQTLDDAAELWPELRLDRAALLRKVIEAGHETIAHSKDEAAAARRAAVHRAAGAATGAYPAEAAASLKREWPR